MRARSRPPGLGPFGALLGGWLGHTIGIVPALWVAVAGGAVAALPVAVSPLLSMRDLPDAPDEIGRPAGDPSS